MKEDAPDAESRPRRAKWWLWLPLGCFGFVLLFFFLGAAIVSGRASTRWKEFVPREAALKARVLGRSVARERLEGEATLGNAFQGYVDAAAALAKMSEAEKSAIWETLGGKAAPELEKKAYAALDAHAAELDALRAAARKGDYRATIDWEDGFNAKFEWLGTFRQASRVLSLSARRRRLAGDIDGAIEDVATVLQLGVDCGHSGATISYLVGGFDVRNATFQARDILEEPLLTGAQAERIEKLAARCDASMATLVEMLEGERLIIDETCRALVEGRAHLSDFGSADSLRALAWRQGFSFRVLAADLDEAFLRLTEESAKVADRPWKDALSLYNRFEAEWKSNPILSLFLLSPEAIDRSSRAVHARLRLLQAFARERRTGLAMDPMPLDSFTARPLHRSEKPGSVLWWSEYADGDDDGGAGKFDEDPADDGDIPVEWVKGK